MGYRPGMEVNTVSNSRLAAMLGLDEHKSQLSLFHELRGEIPEIKDNEAMRQGRYYERATAQLCCDLKGMQLIDEGAQDLVTRGRFSGHRDFACIDEHGKLCVLEVKNLMFADQGDAEDGWGDPETDQVPTKYLIQQMAYIHTHRGTQIRDHEFADYGYIAARLRSGVKRYKIPLNPKVIEKIDREMEEFLRMVNNNEPPTPKTEEDARNRWVVADGKKMEADATIFEALKNNALLKEQIKELEDQVKANNLLVLTYAKDAEALVYKGQTVATLKANKAFDEEACIADHPKILEQYSKLDKTRLKAEQPTLYEMYSRRPETAVKQTRPILLKKKLLLPQEVQA